MSDKQKQERRYRRTEKMILDGLTTLLQSKSIKEISVRELSDLVDINRSTFYLHYADIYDLLEKTEERLLAELSNAVENDWERQHNPDNFFKFLPETFDLCF